MATLKELREKRDAIAKEMRNLHDTKTGALWTPEVQAQWDGFSADIDRIDDEMKRHQKILDIEAARLHAATDRADREGISADEANARTQADKKLLIAWIRGGWGALTPEQHASMRNRATDFQAGISNLGTQVPSEGGFLAPDEPSNELLSAMKEFGGMREVATTMNTRTGNVIPWPTTDRTGNKGSIVGENSAVGSAAARTFGTVNIGAHMYTSGAIAIPFQLLQDSMIDVEGEVVGGLAECLQRIQNEHFTTGTGVNQPSGLMTRAYLGATGAAGQTVSVLWEDLIELEHSVDPAYRRQGCRFMFHDSTLKFLKKTKDGEGRPIWLPDYTAKEPATILTYPYTINQDMAAMAASAKSIAFGNLKKYRIRDVMGYMLFRMTDSAYTLLGQVGFVAFMRSDGQLVAADNTCIRYYQHPAA